MSLRKAILRHSQMKFGTLIGGDVSSFSAISNDVCGSIGHLKRFLFLRAKTKRGIRLSLGEAIRGRAVWCL